MRFLWLVVLFISATSVFAQTGPPEKESIAPTVDVELVLAVDVSYSMDKDQLALRREGYAQAIVSKEFLETLKAGPTGRVAVTYFEWSASNYQKVIVPWRMIDGPETAAAVAAEIMQAPAVPHTRTSISGAIDFAMSLLEKDSVRGSRRVIDVSGNGPNNNGGPVLAARDAALPSGIIINGLPIMFEGASRSDIDIENLDVYYEDCVAGGSGSFVMSVRDRDTLKDAIRTMLVAEVAGRIPERANVSSTGDKKRISYLIGEEIFERAWKKPPGTPQSTKSATNPSFTTWQLSEFAAYTKKCFARQREKVRNKIELSVTVGPDGMIIGDPVAVSPIDSDALRRDMQLAIRKLRLCQPYIVDPFARVRVQFTQVFQFGFSESKTAWAVIRENFRKCWTPSRTGPAIWVSLNYKPDGTYQGTPNLVNPQNTEEYSRAAARVIRQITKCPPVHFSKDNYPDQSIRWQFPSYESAKASR